jgi:hypothetical protein
MGPREGSSFLACQERAAIFLLLASSGESAVWYTYGDLADGIGARLALGVDTSKWLEEAPPVDEVEITG